MDFGKTLTHRTKNDLSMQLVYWEETSPEMRLLALQHPMKAGPSPTFVENMMGFPKNWTDVDFIQCG